MTLDNLKQGMSFPVLGQNSNIPLSRQASKLRRKMRKVDMATVRKTSFKSGAGPCELSAGEDVSGSATAGQASASLSNPVGTALALAMKWLPWPCSLKLPGKSLSC